MGGEKRQSDRLMLTIPLRVEGTDDKGIPFKQEARTVSVNRHGARIRVPRSLRNGQKLRLVNLVSQRQADFRVVGPVSPPSSEASEWGVECLDFGGNIWGIHFPPLPEGEDTQAAALVECRSCHTVAVMRLTIVEAEVLETSGVLSKPCDACKHSTSWGYVEQQMDMGAQPDMSGLVGETPARPGGPRGGVDRRQHSRALMRIPIRVRDYYGGTEIVQSANASKGGFCFLSDKDYQLGQGIMVVCPYHPTEHSIEVSAHIVRRQPFEGTKQTIYAARYDAPGTQGKGDAAR